MHTNLLSKKLLKSISLSGHKQEIGAQQRRVKELISQRDMTPHKNSFRLLRVNIARQALRRAFSPRPRERHLEESPKKHQQD